MIDELEEKREKKKPRKSASYKVGYILGVLGVSVAGLSLVAILVGLAIKTLSWAVG